MKLYVQDFALRIMLSSYIVSVRIMLFRSKTNLFKDIEMIGRHFLVIFSINLHVHVVLVQPVSVFPASKFLVVTSQLELISSLCTCVFPPVPHLSYTV